MNISAADVNKLRTMTGAGMMDCKKALTEANGDFENAIDILRKKGQKIAAARADRESSEGTIFLKTNEAQTEGLAIGLNCETDFVAKTEGFLKLGEAILEAAYTKKPADIATLLTLTLDSRTVAEHLSDMMGKIGEKIEVSSYEVVTGEKVISYQHGAKIGVLVVLKNAGGNSEIAGKDVAMQIAAMRPIALDKDGVSTDLINREIEIGKEQARAEGKPENMLEKIALGKLAKFYKDYTLLNQEFIKDPKLTVTQYLDATHKGMTVVGYKRIGIGVA
jgi:elongation factor Ts